MRGHTAALGGTYIANPRWYNPLGRNLVTVHPLGGCIMASDAATGVVDHRGRVYDPSRGLNAIHSGLFVVDGATIPTAVGVNPLLTISGLAERHAALLNADATVDMTPRAFNRATYVEVRRPIGLHFTEEMKGYFTEGLHGDSLEDYRAAERSGRQSGRRLSVWLWMAIEHLDAFLDNPDHEALVSGYVDYAPLGGKRMIDRGRFNMFVDTLQAHTKQLRYSLAFTASDGEPYLLAGFKDIRDDRGWDAWSDNTTLFTTLYRGTTPGDQVYGRGIIHVLIWDLIEQVASFRVHNASTTVTLEALNRFGAFFFGELWASYVKQRLPQS
jgi:cholesterol oxidase